MTLANLAVGNTAAGSSTVAIADGTAQLTVGQPVSGPGIPAGATVTAITSATSTTISAAATATTAGVPLVFGTVGQLAVTLPSDITNVALEGGPGDNWIQVDPSVTRNMYLYGGPGHNTLMAGSGSDTLVAGPGTGVLYGGTGNDFLYGGDLPSQDVPPQLSSAGQTNPRANPVEGHDTLIAGAGDSELFAGSGGDVLIGGSVARSVGPGGTPGLAILQNGQYQLIEGAGHDLIVGGNNPNASDLLIAGPGGPGAFLQAGAGNDVLVADNYGSNMLVAGGGTDLLLGGNLDNVMIGGAGVATLVGGLGSDKLLAGSGNTVLYATYNAAAWSQAQSVAAAAGVHLVPPQLLQGDDLSAQIEALLVKQATQALNAADQQTLHDDLLKEFTGLYDQDSALVAQITALEKLFGSLTTAQKQQLDSLYNQDILILQERIQFENYLNSYTITAGDATNGPKGGFGTKMLIGLTGNNTFHGDPVLPTWMGGNGTFFNYHPGDTITGGAGTDNTLMFQGDGAVKLTPDAGNAVDLAIPSLNGGVPFPVGNSVGNVSGIQFVGVQTGDADGDTVTLNFLSNGVLQSLPSGLKGVSVQLGNGNNDVIDAVNFQNAEVLRAGAGSDTIKITGSLPTGSTIQGSAAGSTELDVLDPTSSPVAVTGGVLKINGVPLNGEPGNTASGSNTITGLASVALLAVGQTVTGPGIPAGATVAAILSTSSITISANATATVNGVPLVFGTSFRKLVVIGGPGSNVFTSDGTIPNVVLQGGDGANNTFNVTGPGSYTIVGGGPASAPAPLATAGVAAPTPSGISHTSGATPGLIDNGVAVSAGTKALFAGGTGTSSTGYRSSAVNIYDVTTNSWSTTTLPSGPRQYLAGTAVGTKAFFAGGETSSAITAEVDIYDVSTGSWSTTALPSGPRENLAATTVGTKAIFAGGSGSAAVDIYDTTTGTWSKGTLPSGARGYLAATAVGTKAIFAGGYNGNYVKWVDIYDVSTGQWTTGTLSQAYIGSYTDLVATTAGTKAFFTGGTASGTNVVDVYDASTATWSTTALPSGPRVQLAATAVGNKALFGGGANNTFYTTVDIYDASTGQWSTSPFSQGRGFLEATSVGNKAIFAGGDNGPSFVNAADFYTFAPTITVSTPSGTVTGNATISYTLADSASNACSIQVQYSVSGGPWQVATSAGGDGTSGLASSPTGTTHTFVWNTAHDLGATNNASVQVRIAPANAVGTGVTQASGSFAVNNSAVTNALNIAFTDGSNDTVKLVQSGSTVTFSGTAANSGLAGTATNVTSVSVSDGTGNNVLDAFQMILPVTLSGGNGSGADTLIGGAGSDTLYYSGAGSTYAGGGGINNQLVYAARSGDNLALQVPAVQTPELVVNGAPRNPGRVTGIQGFRVSGSPASVNGGTQLNWPFDVYPLTSATISSLTVAANSPVTSLSARFTDTDPSVPGGVSLGAYAATIDWGDGTTSAGTIGYAGGSTLTVAASHVYAASGTRSVNLMVFDNAGGSMAATSIAAPDTGGLTLSAGTLSSFSGATATTLDSGVTAYLVRNADATVFSLHADGSLWTIAGSGAKQQVDTSVQSIMLAPDNTLFALHASGDLDAGSPVTALHFIESGEKAILQDNNGTAYRLYTSGALYAMTAGSSWTQVKANVAAITLDPSGAAIDVLTNDGNASRFDGTTWTFLAGPHFAFTLAGPVTAGQAVPVSLAVLDYHNNPVPGYTGTAQVTNSDAAAGTPAPHPFTGADNGAYPFNITFLTAGTQTLTATDGNGLTASVSVTVGPAAASRFSVDPPSMLVGSAAPVTVTAYDAYGNVATGYTGTVKLSPTDPGATVPASYTFASSALTGNTTAGSATITGLASTASLNVGEPVAGPGIPAGATIAWIASGTSITISGGATATASSVPLTFGDQGMHTFSATFTRAGAQKLVAADTAGTGSVGAGDILITPAPVDLSQSTVSVNPTNVGAGLTSVVTLTERDQYGNQESTGGDRVSFILAAGSSGGGNFSATRDNGDGTYSATFTAGGLLGNNNLTATVNGQPITSSPASLVVVPGTPSPTASTLSISPGSVPSGGTATVTLTAVDAFGNLEPAGMPIVFGVGSGSARGTFGTATYAGNGVYTATFTGTTAGSNTITATVGGVTLTSTAPTITVTPGAVSLAQSLVTVSPGSVASGATATVTLITKDAAGNPLTTGGLAVVFGLGSGSASGTIGSASYAGNGTYTATFTGITAGSAALTATIGGQAVTSAPPSITVTPGAVSLAQSVVTVAPGSVGSGTTATVTLTARDAAGNPLTTGGLAVAFGLGNGSGAGTFSLVTDHGNGTYTATFTGTTLGSVTIKATIGGQGVTSALPSVTVTGSPSLSTVTASAASIRVGETVAVSLTVRDGSGNPVNSGGLAVVFGVTAGSSGGTFSAASYQGNGTYTATFTTTIAGSDALTATINGQPLTSTPPTVTVTPGPATGLAILTSPQTLTAGQPSAPITVQLEDADGNAVLAGAGGLAVNLSTDSPGGTFLNGSGHPLPAPTVTIQAGSATAAFAYQDGQTGTPTLIASIPRLSEAVQQEAVLPAGAAFAVAVSNLTATAGTPFSGPVGTFTIADLSGPASAFSATIAWGDGQSSVVTPAGVGGSFTVRSTHTYAAGGRFPLSVTVTQTGSSATGAGFGLAHVAQNSPPPSHDKTFLIADTLTTSAEYYTDFVTSAYETYLHRLPDAVGLAGWVSGMQSYGVTDEDIEAGFIGSAEYIAGKGGGPGNWAPWVTSMYQDLLGRTQSPTEMQPWVNFLNGGGSTTYVAHGFAASAEREHDRVAADYERFLGRAPTDAEVAQWVNAFAQDLATNEYVIAGFLGSTEYYLKNYDDAVDWLFALYADALGRNPDPASLQGFVNYLQG